MSQLHRIREVRQREEVTLRTVRRYTQFTTEHIVELEKPDSDPRLSELRAIAEAIGMPVAELICDCDHDEVFRLRSTLLRIARIANTLLGQMHDGEKRRLVESINSQIAEHLPPSELGGLPVGRHRRPADEPSRRDELVSVPRWEPGMSEAAEPTSIYA